MPSHYSDGPTRVAALGGGGRAHLKSLQLGGWGWRMESYRPALAAWQICACTRKHTRYVVGHPHLHRKTTKGKSLR